MDNEYLNEDIAQDTETLDALASTPVDLAKLGLNEVAYVRRAVVDNQPVWSIHNAAGEAVGATLTRDQAWGAIVQNDMTPLYVN